jgi:hypothetical protein
MLVELAAANAAFAVIKEAIANSGEIASAARSVIDWFNAKNDLQAKIEKKPENQRSDLEEFFALEELKRQQQELKELMIYQGRPGLWNDWLEFQVKARQAREAAERERIRAAAEKKKKRGELLQNILLGFWLSVLGLVLAGIIMGAVWLYTKGKL